MHLIQGRNRTGFSRLTAAREAICNTFFHYHDSDRFVADLRVNVFA